MRTHTVHNIHLMCQVGEDDRAWPRAEAREARGGPTCPGDLRGGAFCPGCFQVWADAWEEAANHSGEKVLRTRSGGRGPAHSQAGPWGPERRIWQKRAFCNRGCCLSRRRRGNGQRRLRPGRQSKALGKWSRSRRPSASRGTLRRDHPEVVTSGWPGSWTRKWGSSPSPGLGMPAHSSFPQWEPFSRTQLWESGVPLRPFGWCRWLDPVKAFL